MKNNIRLILVAFLVAVFVLQPSSIAQASGGTYKCEFVKQTPADYTVFAPKAQFDMYWTLKNTGTATWTGIQLVFVSGRAINTYPAPFALTSTTPPGQRLKVGVDMMAPKLPGTYVTNWGLAKNGVVFCRFYLILTVR